MSDIRPKRITYDLEKIVADFWEQTAVYDTVDGTRVPHKGTVRGRLAYGDKYAKILNAIVVFEPETPDDDEAIHSVRPEENPQ